MKKLIMASIAAIMVASASLSASTQTADPNSFALAKSISGCSSVTVAYVDTGQKNIAFASIQKINAISTVYEEPKKWLPTLGSKSTIGGSVGLHSNEEDILGSIKHRFGSDTLKISAITDYGRDKFEVGWTEGQSKIDSKQTI